MDESAKYAETTDAKRGLIGFFDVLGYKMIQTNNPINEAISVIEKIRKVIEKHQNEVSKWSQIMEKHFGEHVVISDSILTFTPFESDQNKKGQAEMFVSFAAGIVNDLFWEGLPARGALAYGDFYVKRTATGIYLAGAPIVEAHELGGSLDLSGCIVAASAEEFLRSQEIIDASDRPLGFIKYGVPLKSREPTKFSTRDHYMLNHRAIHQYEPAVTPQLIMQQFAKFNKSVTKDAQRKATNTHVFFADCEA